jgi:hypothetical protein
MMASTGEITYQDSEKYLGKLNGNLAFPLSGMGVELRHAVVMGNKLILLKSVTHGN